MEQDVEKQFKTVWSWIDNLEARLKHLESHDKILVTNNENFIEWHKQLRAKDAQHDATDKQIKATLDTLKQLGKTVEQIEEST